MRRPKVHQLGFSSSCWPWTVYGVLFVPTIGFIVATFGEARCGLSVPVVAGCYEQWKGSGLGGIVLRRARNSPMPVAELFES